jgi:hypothetical protein
LLNLDYISKKCNNNHSFAFIFEIINAICMPCIYFENNKCNFLLFSANYFAEIAEKNKKNKKIKIQKNKTKKSKIQKNKTKNSKIQKNKIKYNKNYYIFIHI